MALRRFQSHRRQRIALAVLTLLDAPLAALALPQGAQVVEGQVTVGTPAAGQLGISQGSARAVVDWRSFGIGAREGVTLTQPGGGMALFRITGSDPSQIFGSLSATGTLFLSNPNGVLFGAGARVDVGSLVATTLGTGNADFMAGRLRFAGESRASVVNEGRITAATGGAVVLLGASVANSGSITASQGSVALGAGSAATLDVYGNGLLKLNLTAGADGARVDHSGTVLADGGVASLSALGRAGSAPAAINVSGLVRAQSLTTRDGAIFLSGGSGSTVAVSGTLDASSAVAGAQAGRIEVSGERITVDAGARLLADAKGSGHGGAVNTIASDAMTFAGSISARGGSSGGDGGNAEVSGRAALTMSGASDLSAPVGRTGTLLLDPGSISIIDSAGNQNGPNQFGDANLATLLGTNNITISTANATGGGAETISVDAAANVTWGAATTLTLNAGRNINVGGGAVIQNTNAGATAFNAIVLNANQGAAAAAGNYAGVQLVSGARLETSRGNIRVTGRGGSTGNFNNGVLITGAVTLRSANGNIVVTGQGGGDAASTDGRGISLESNPVVTATGTGNISLTGTGGVGIANNIGVVFLGAGPGVRTASGNLSVVGTGGAGGFAAGVVSQSAVILTATSGNVLVQGTGNGGTLAIAISNTAATIGGAGMTGNVTLTGDRIDLPTLTASTTGTILLQPLTSGRLINVGGADSSTALGLDLANDLARLTAGRLEIGNANAGNLTVSAAYAPAAGTGTLALVSGGTVGVNATITGGNTRLSLSGTAGVRLGASLSSNAANVAATRAISIRTPGSFNNTVGASALSTPNGSWAISLPTPVGQTFNGLLSGNDAVWSNPVTSSVNPTGNRYSFALAPTIFINAETLSKTYGDALVSTVSPNGAAVASLANTFGGVFTDYATGTLSGSYGRASAGLAGTANVGSYALTVTDVSQLTTTKAGYGFAIGLPGVLGVSPRTVVLAPDPVTRNYGDANPSTGTATVTAGSLVNGDALGSVALNSQAVATSNVGNYNLTMTGVSFASGLASNYAVSFVTTVNGLSIAPRPVSLTPDAVSRVYGDALVARGSATLTAGSLVGGDAVADVALSSAATAASFVGSYALSAGGAAFSSGSAANYAITYTDRAGGLTVTPRPVTLTLQGSVSRPYGGGTLRLGLLTPVATVGSLAAGDSVNGYSASFPGPGLAAPVGSYSTSLTTVALRNAANQTATANYALTLLGAPYLVTPRPVTLTPVQASRSYGDANPAVAAVTSNSGFGVGLVNGDVVSQVSLSSAAGLASNVGVYASTGSNALFSIGASSNYAISYGSNASGLNVTPRALTLTPVAVSRIYGNANPASAGATGSVGGLVNGDTVASVSLNTPATAASSVGSYATTGSGAVFGNGLSTNYAIDYASNPAGLDVTPRALTLTPDVASRIYGDANPARGAATGSLGGLVNGDVVASVALASPATPASPVGAYASSGSDALFGNGLASNYKIDYVDNAAGVNVAQRPLTLTPDALSRLYGDSNPASGTATGNAGGLVNGDAVARVTLGTPATVTSPVGSYASSGSNAVFGSGAAGNYAIAYATNAAGLSITPRALTLTPDPQTRAYGDANPARGTASGSAGGLVNGDAVASVQLASPATPTSNVGRYATSGSAALFGTGLASNYTIAYADNAAGLDVTPRALTLTPETQSRAYGDTNPATATASGNAGGLVNGDTVASVKLTSPAGVTSNVGSYATSGSAALFGTGLASNYTIAYADNAAGLSVAPRALTLTPDAQSRHYGDVNPASGSATGNAGGLVNGDAVASVALASNATPASHVGMYGTSASNAVFGSGLATNYRIAYADNPLGLAIVPRALTLTPDALSRIYGDANPLSGSASGDAGGLVNGDAVALVTLGSNATAASNVGSYRTTGADAVFAAGLASDYTITYAPNPAGLSVTTRALTLVPDAQSRTYGDANPARGNATGNAGGLVNGDAVASVGLASVAGASSNVGQYTITASDAVFGAGLASNYTIDYVANPNGLAVTPRALTLTPDTLTRAYGDATPARGGATGNAGGLVNGDAVASVAIASPAQTSSSIGSYAVTASDAAFAQGLAGNYRIGYAPRADGLIVTPRDIGVSALPGQSKFVGRSDPVFGYQVSSGSLVPGDNFSGSLTRTPGEAPGIYTIEQGTLGLGANYAIAYTGAPFVVGRSAGIAPVDRAPAVGAPSAAAQAFANLIAALPATAAGPSSADDLSSECVRDTALGNSAAAPRFVSRGLRLPPGVVDRCRPSVEGGGS